MKRSGSERPLNLRAVIKRARLATILVAAGCAIYIGSRFDMVTLPVEGCSPVSAFQPGARLLVDRWAPGLASGDVVFVGEAGGNVHLGLLGDSGEAQSWFLLGDADGCPSRFPKGEQPVRAEAVLGRVILNLGR